jgi:competence protein ComEA
VPGAGAAPAPVPLASPVDLNRAGPAELDALPGLGPVLAERIVEHRRRHGRFERVEDLLAVRGVGPRLLERLRPRVRVGP